jgi:hypothetical protein
MKALAIAKPFAAKGTAKALAARLGALLEQARP